MATLRNPASWSETTVPLESSGIIVHCCSTGFLQADHPGRGKNPVGTYGDDCRYNKTGEKPVALNFNCILQEPRSIWMGLKTSFDVFWIFF